MDSTTTITLIVTVLLALSGYLITYWNNIRIANRQERLSLVNRRISEFYGPLFIATQASARAYKALLLKLDKTAVFDDPESPPSQLDINEWRIWLENVFMPKNELIEKLIIEKAYLIQEQEIPDCLLQFITHISGYRAVLTKWKANNLSENLSVIEFPSEISKYATSSYQQLKAEQLSLIR